MANFSISLFYTFTIVLLIVSNLAHATPGDSIRERRYGKQDVYLNDVKRISSEPVPTSLPVPVVEAKGTEQDKTLEATKNPKGQNEQVSSPASNQATTEPQIANSPSSSMQPSPSQAKKERRPRKPKKGAKSFTKYCTQRQKRCLRRLRCYRYVPRRWRRHYYYHRVWYLSRYCRGRCRVKAWAC